MLQKRVLKQGIDSLAIIGLAKNVGKTTVLNGLVAEAREKEIPVGLVSIGVDGEERDVWSGRLKPPVYVPAGSFVATAGPLLDLEGYSWEVMEETGVQSAVGEVLIARALHPTHVKLAGITAAEAAAKIDRQFRILGAQLTLVDGAYDRKAAANPFITKGTICVVGGSMASTLDQVLEKTAELVHLFTLPECADSTLKLAAEQAVQKRQLFAVHGEKIAPLPFSSLFVSEKVLRRELERKPWKSIAIPGALTDRSLSLLTRMGKPLQLVLNNPTCNFVSLAVLRRFFQIGGSISYLRRSRLLGIAINPLAPSGYSFDPEEMRERIASVCTPLPVFDMVRDPV